jgi:hypothetical protein
MTSSQPRRRLGASLGSAFREIFGFGFGFSFGATWNMVPVSITIA